MTDRPTSENAASEPAPSLEVRERQTIGRATCSTLVDGSELWRWSDRQDPALVRIRAWEGLGGFTKSGEDDDGAWMWRPAVEQRLDAWLRVGPHPWADVRGIVVALVDRLRWCEDRALFPGPLDPGEVVVEDGGEAVVLRADSMLRSLSGGSTEEATGSPGLSRWVPPEQANGEPWDNAANRYVVGLVLYRALCGHHPFSGQGLRRGLEQQAQQGAAPFPDEVAREVPPGLQSLCLLLLEPEASRRPASAKVVRKRLAALEEPTDAPASSGPSKTKPSTSSAPVGIRKTVSPPPGLPRASASHSPDRWWRRFGVIAPIIGGVALALGLGTLVEPPPPAAAPPRVADAAPLTVDQTRADDCAACHPRQVAQWSQSVMAHAARSPMFQALEILIQEQVGRSFDCPEGAGALRGVDPRTACREPNEGRAITGSGGELWCVNCHAAGENLKRSMPAWDGRSRGSSSRHPLRDLLPDSAMEGISCAVCHTTHGPVRPGDEAVGRYEGNPGWVSFITGDRFSSRPEDRRGLFGIANSGYSLDPWVLIAGPNATDRVPGGAHRRTPPETREYLRKSEFCGACHDVRLFGTDVVGVRERGEHFKRLRNAYSEWDAWATAERRAGREPASCQDCHMSEFPGLCVPDEDGLPGSFIDPGATALRRACPPGTHFESREPGAYPKGRASLASDEDTITTHYFSGVDAPLTPGMVEELIEDPQLDEAGVPRGLSPRRDILLGRTFRFEVRGAESRGGQLTIPVELENTGAGHRVPAGFSQEREIWVHLKVTDADGRLVYEVGRVDRGDEDLHDKQFVRVNVDDRILDAAGQPQGVFGADVRDGPDVPQWSPSPRLGGSRFRGKGLINLQNGFLRCVTCIGRIDASGQCQPLPGQGIFRADRFADGQYDLDTGECGSNLVGDAALFEIYFPVGALDASRGGTRGPDAIIDTRSAPPGVPLHYTYELLTGGATGPFTVDARLMFRAFPPFLVRAFADYEAIQDARGNRPSGPLVTHDMLERLEVVELNRVRVTLP